MIRTIVLMLLLHSVINAQVNLEEYKHFYQMVTVLAESINNKLASKNILQESLNKLSESDLSTLPEIQSALKGLQKTLDRWEDNQQSTSNNEPKKTPVTNLNSSSKVRKTEMPDTLYTDEGFIIKDTTAKNNKLTLIDSIQKIIIKPDLLQDSSETDSIRQKFEQEQRSSLFTHSLKDAELEIDNLILNESITKIGKDFYDIFYKNWVPPEKVENVTIIIGEKPLPTIGTRVTIRVNDYYVFQRVLQPRYEVIEAAALSAVNTVFDFLNNYEQIQQSLQGEDMLGTGIY